MTSQAVLSPKAAELLKKAEEAFDARNFEYSGLLYHSVLALCPEFHKARFKLHLSTLRFHEAHPEPRWKRILAAIRAVRFYSLASWNMKKKDWLGACAQWEEALRILPVSPSLHWKNAKCLEQLGWMEATIQAYQILRLLVPQDTAILWQLARLYFQENRLEDAREVYEAIHGLLPNDPKVPAELRKIAAIMTIEKGGWKDLGTYRDKIRDERQAQLLEQRERLVKSAADIDQMLSALTSQRASRPSDFNLLREIGKLYRLKGDLANAKEALREALRLAPGDFLLAKSLHDMELEEIEHEIDQRRSDMLAHPEDTSKVEALEKLLAKYRLALLQDKKNQVAQYPTNLLLRFELGILFLELEMVDEAIAEFQQAVKNPAKRLEVQKYLGECFKRKRLYDLAVEQFSAALKAIPDMSSLKKDILYALGGVYEEMGKGQDAKREYEKIYTVDIAYKDVAQKIEKKFRSK